MIEYFTEKDFQLAKKQRKKVLGWYYGILGAFFSATLGLFLYYLTLPYNAPAISTIKTIQHVLSGLFVIFSFLYLGIVYKRTNKYFRVTRNLMEGLKETSTASFFEYKDQVILFYDSTVISP